LILEYFMIEVVVSNEKIRLPSFVGSKLRGAFGNALKKRLCLSKERCLSSQTLKCVFPVKCPYYSIFAKDNITHPYRIETNLNPENLNMKFYLFGLEFEHLLADIAHALYDLYEIEGIDHGKNKIFPKVLSMRCNGVIIYEDNIFDFDGVIPIKKEIADYHKNILVTVETPLNIRHKGKITDTLPPFYRIVNSAHSILNNHIKNLQSLDKKVEGDIVTHNIINNDTMCFSNFEKKHRKLKGYLSIFRVNDVDERSYQILKLAEITGIGGHVSYGYGKIKVEGIV